MTFGTSISTGRTDCVVDLMYSCFDELNKVGQTYQVGVGNQLTSGKSISQPKQVGSSSPCDSSSGAAWIEKTPKLATGNKNQKLDSSVMLISGSET